MEIVQAVFGVFHHFELAHQLHARGHLKKIYSTWPWARLKREGLDRALVGTLPWIHTANYLLNRARWYPESLSIRMDRWNALAFDQYTRRVTPPCDAFIAISGAGLLTGKRVQERGGVFVCDRGSTHQRVQTEVVREEFRRWKLPPPTLVPHITEREEAIYAAADAITVPSSAAKRSFLRMGVPDEKVHVIPYGVRLDRFRRAEGVAPPDDCFHVLCAGQVTLRKGAPYLLQAFARLRHPRKRLTFVGSVHPSVEPLLRELPTDDVEFTGALPQPELAERMARSHVLALASVEEGLALVQAQAMACECPVIATQATGAEDLLTDGVEGFIVPDRDVDALAERLQRLADDSSLQRGMAAAALARVRMIGGWDDYGRCWDQLLHRLTGIAPDGD
jgi:glycosyltransferase involved in cell wall biosynthesis